MRQLKFYMTRRKNMRRVIEEIFMFGSGRKRTPWNQRWRWPFRCSGCSRTARTKRLTRSQGTWGKKASHVLGSPYILLCNKMLRWSSLLIITEILLLLFQLLLSEIKLLHCAQSLLQRICLIGWLASRWLAGVSLNLHLLECIENPLYGLVKVDFGYVYFDWL